MDGASFPADALLIVRRLGDEFPRPITISFDFDAKLFQFAIERRAGNEESAHSV